MHRHEIRQKVREYILCHFLEIIASNDEMLSLSREELLDIINDDTLNTKSEVAVWEFCMKWIAFDEENRLQLLPLALHGVRLGLLDQTVNTSTLLSRLFWFIKRIYCTLVFDRIPFRL